MLKSDGWNAMTWTAPLGWKPSFVASFAEGQRRVASTRSLGSALDIRGYDGANGGKAPISCLTVDDTPTSAMAEKRHFYMRVYWAVPDSERTPECLSDGASD